MCIEINARQSLPKEPVDVVADFYTFWCKQLATSTKQEVFVQNDKDGE